MKKIIEAIHTSLWKCKLFLEESIRKIQYKEKLKESLRFQDKYTGGQRCFIIGNGPSLKDEDLEKIAQHGDISFAANRIYNVFSDVVWRPTYYGVCDIKLFNNSRDEINKVTGTKFIPLDIYSKFANVKDDYYIWSRIPVTFFNRPPKFSNNMTERFGEGGTITYHFLQMAVAMGFKEIYLIGIDFSFSYGIGPDGKYFEDKTVKHNHHGRDDSKLDTVPNLYNQIRAYKKANDYAQKNGIHIYNATRGGKLEVFKRVDFDSLF